MKESLNKYRNLKSSYFKILSDNPRNKGHMRAYIGGLTSLYERDLLRSSNDYIEAHTTAFEMALEDASTVMVNKTLHDKLEIVKAKWADLPKKSSTPGAESPILESPIRKIGNWSHNGLNAISLFSGAMGLDLGLMASGFDVRLANDIDPKSKETVLCNLPELSFINRDIDTVTTRELLDYASIPKGELDVLVGGPPCQPFSPAGKRAGLSDPRASPLRYFIKGIKEMKPRAFVMEEVPGLLSSRLKHFPISERGKRIPTAEEREGSAFKIILDMLNSTGYHITFGRVNAADYGSPQVRERLIFIGLRDQTPSLPKPTYSSTPGKGTLPWNSFWEATADIRLQPGDYPSISSKTTDYINYVPPGGNWRELPADIVKTAMGGAFYSGGGKMGFYRRMSWHDPSPTVVTTPMQKGTMFIHPEENRPISVEEYARVQGFPEDWQIAGNLFDKYRLIGNAVPVHLAHAIGSHVRDLLYGNVRNKEINLFSFEITSSVNRMNSEKLIEKERELISFLLKEEGGYSGKKADRLSSYFGGLKDFAHTSKDALSNVKLASGKLAIKKEDIDRILSVRDMELIDLRKPLPDNFISLIARNFTRRQVSKLQGITLSSLYPNPFLIQSLNLSTPEEVVRLNVYAFATRSIVTSFGSIVENLLEATSETVERGEDGWDLLKTERNGKKHWIQVKSGTNDMDKDQIVYWANKIDEIVKSGDEGYIGMTYGKRDDQTVSLGLIRQYLSGYEKRILVGRELWEFLSEDSELLSRVLDILLEQAISILNGENLIDEVEKSIVRVTKEFVSQYGEGTEGVRRYIGQIL